MKSLFAVEMIKKINERVIILKKDTRDARISKEEKRLTNIYNGIEGDKLKIIDGLVKRSAFMRIELEDLETDLNKNGFVEEFSQSDRVEPYQRKRPAASIYISLNSAYQKIIKQLSDLLPDIEPEKPQDELLAFLNRGVVR